LTHAGKNFRSRRSAGSTGGTLITFIYSNGQKEANAELRIVGITTRK
jgi:hypothetical protein